MGTSFTMTSMRGVDQVSKERGFTLIELMIIIAIVAIVASISIPNLLQARKNGNEASAIGALKTISATEAIFREGDKEQDGNFDYGMLSELNNTGLIDTVLGTGAKQGYLFQCTYSFTTSEFDWFGVANPAVPGISGDRYFAANMAGVIYYTTGGNLVVDTYSCLLPGQGAMPTSK
jgi:prepilin-type N-terminal cleavage/methylation domain-containing protein